MKAERHFAADATSVRAARQFVVETLHEFPTAFVEDVVLVVSELATNSVIHAHSPFRLCLEPDARSLRIELTDEAGDLPRKRSPELDEPYGRGLHIVDALAESWGVALAAEGGKTIWVVVPLPEQPQTVESTSGAGAFGQRVNFDDLIPSWLFVVKPAWLRLVVGLAGPLLAWPALATVNNPQLRVGPLLGTLLVVVAAVAGFLALAVAGTGAVALYWYYGVPTHRSFALHGSDVLSVAGMTVLVLALLTLARRTERAVIEVRHLDEVRRHEAEEQAELRRRAERIASQAESVLAVGSVLTRAHTLTDVAQAALTQISIPTAPTSASIAVVENNRLRVVASRGVPGELRSELERLDVNRSAWLSAVLSGEPAYVEDREEFAAKYPSALVLRMYDSRSWLVAPFHAEDTLGLLSLHFDEPQPLKEYRLYFSLVAELLGSSLERARSEEHQRRQHRELELAFAERDRIARTLSTSLLPPALPRIAGFSVAAWLAPASGDEVAGDFYDLFAVDDGWVGVLGDVCGKGAEAAAVTSLARYASRAAALENSDPAHIVRVANQALVAEPSELFCTAAVVRYLRSAGSLEVSLAGHLQARLVCDGEVQRIGRFGAALGLGIEHPNVDRYPMPKGSVVVLFSDGLVERDPDFGERDLDRFLAEHKGLGAQELASQLRALVAQLRPKHPDDIAVLVLERTG